MATKLKKRKSGIGKKIRVALLAAILFAAIGLYANYWLNQPLSAVMFVVCGKPQGVLVTMRNGEQQFHQPNDVMTFIDTDKLPDERKGTLRASGPYCEQPPEKKVY